MADETEIIIESQAQLAEQTPEVDFSVTQLEGVGAMTEKKLTEFGVSSIIDICIRGAAEVAEITGVAKSKADIGCLNHKRFLKKQG